MDVYLAVFDRASFVVSEELLGAVESYINEHYVDTCSVRRQQMEPLLAEAAPRGLDDLMERLDEPFNTTLLRRIDAKGMTDAEVYKRANIDRKLFSKIRIGKGYMPGKRTILALAGCHWQSYSQNWHGSDGIHADRAVDYLILKQHRIR